MLILSLFATLVGRTWRGACTHLTMVLKNAPLGSFCNPFILNDMYLLNVACCLKSYLGKFCRAFTADACWQVLKSHLLFSMYCKWLLDGFNGEMFLPT